jgi:cyanate permease
MMRIQQQVRESEKMAVNKSDAVRKFAHSPYLFLLFIWLVITFAFLQIFSVPPIIDILIIKYQISSTEAGLLMGIPPFMIAIFAIIGGVFCDKFGFKKIVFVSLAMLSLASIVRALSQDFLQLLILTIIMSIGIAVLLPNIPKIVKLIFPPSKVGSVTGIYVTGMCVGPAIGLTVTRYLTILMGNSDLGPFLLYGILSLVASFLFLSALNYQTGKICDSSELNTLKNTIWVVIRKKEIILLGLIAFCLEYTFYTVTMWLPSLLISRNEDILIASMIMWTFPVIPLGSYFANTFKRKRILLFASCISISIFLLAIYFSSGLSLWTVTILFGISINVPFSFLFLLPMDFAEENQIGSSTGFVLTVAYLGGIIGPIISGMIIDYTSTVEMGFFAASAIIILGAILSLLIKSYGRSDMAADSLSETKDLKYAKNLINGTKTKQRRKL